MGHNNIWKNHCNKYNISDSEYFIADLDIEKIDYRYHIYCKKCGELLSIQNKLSDRKQLNLLLNGYHPIDDGRLRIYDNELCRNIEL